MYWRSFHRVQEEMAANCRQRLSLIRKNKQLANGMQMMRELVAGSNLAERLLEEQEKVFRLEDRLSVLRTAEGSVQSSINL